MAGVVARRDADRVLVESKSELPDPHHERRREWSEVASEYGRPGDGAKVVSGWEDDLLHELQKGGLWDGLPDHARRGRRQFGNQESLRTISVCLQGSSEPRDDPRSVPCC